CVIWSDDIFRLGVISRDDIPDWLEDESVVCRLPSAGRSRGALAAHQAGLHDPFDCPRDVVALDLGDLSDPRHARKSAGIFVSMKPDGVQHLPVGLRQVGAGGSGRNSRVSGVDGNHGSRSAKSAPMISGICTLTVIPSRERRFARAYAAV